MPSPSTPAHARQRSRSAQWTAEVRGYTGGIPIGGGTGPFTSSGRRTCPRASAILSATDLSFTGIPTTAGTYSKVQLTVRDATGATASGTFSITINAPAPGSILTVAGTGMRRLQRRRRPGKPGLPTPWRWRWTRSGNVFIAGFHSTTASARSSRRPAPSSPWPAPASRLRRRRRARDLRQAGRPRRRGHGRQRQPLHRRQRQPPHA